MIENKDCWMKEKCNHKDCEHFCMRIFKLDHLYSKSLIGLNQRKHVDLRVDDDGTDLEQFRQLKDIENRIVDFVKNGENLYIHSTECGNGKTSWALRMVETYFDIIWPKSPLTCRALFINVPRYLLAIKDNISEKSEYVAHIKNNVYTADMVIWDEVGSKGLTQFEHENILSLINARIDAGKSNIYTSNLNEDDLQVAVGPRLYSRIVNMSHNIELKGSDKRGVIK